MVCRAADQYFGDDTTNVSSFNWSGDVEFKPETWRVPRHRPIDPAAPPPPPPLPGPPFISDPRTGLLSLVEAVADATEKSQALHAIGNAWSFEDCAKSDNVMVSLANLNLQLRDVVDPRNQALTDDWIGRHGNPASRTRLVHFEAGIRIADLCEQLDQLGLAMPTLGGSNGQSLVGAISTSTHGSDWQQPPFPDLVRAVHLVTVGGQELWIESASQPLTRSDAALVAVLPCGTVQVVRDDRIFNAVRVACGRFGVIYSVVLEVRRQFRVVQAVTTPSAASVLQALRDGQKTPSIFTPLFRLLNNDPLPAGLTDATGVPYALQILFNSQRPGDVWVTRRWETTDITKPDVLEGPQGSREELARTIISIVNIALLESIGLGGQATLAVTTALLTLVGGPLGTLLGTQLGATFTVQVLNVAMDLNKLLLLGKPAFGAVLAAALTAAWRIPGLNFLIPQIQGMVIENQLRGGLKADGIRGPHFRVTTGPREDSDQTDFRSDSIELVFDASSPDYLDFLDEIFTVAPFYQQAGYISLRPSLRSTALLSMHNVSGPRAMSIEIASAKDLPGNAGWMSYVHEAGVRFNGRPHWGQYNKLSELSVEMLYAASLPAWREALLSVTGESTLFSNDFTRRRGLEPKRIVRLVTSVKKTKRDTITHLCNDDESWSPVRVADAIQQIQAGTAIYIAVGGENFSFIDVVSDGQGGFYLRSRPDQTSDDNLDNLPLSKKP
jgi:hypothetical protein